MGAYLRTLRPHDLQDVRYHHDVIERPYSAVVHRQ